MNGTRELHFKPSVNDKPDGSTLNGLDGLDLCPTDSGDLTMKVCEGTTKPYYSDICAIIHTCIVHQHMAGI